MRFSNLAVVALSFPFCTRVNSQENEQATEDTPMAATGGLLYSIEDSIYHPTIDFDAIDNISFDLDLDGPPLDLKVEYESSFANELKNPPKEKNADDLAGSEIDSSMDLRIDIGRLRQLEPECPSRPVVNETGSLSAEDFHSLISHCYGENPGIDCPEKYDVGLKCWDTSRIMTMNGAFYDLNFNDDISHWDTSNVRDMNSAFRYCWNFNQNLNAWDTGNVEDMYKMFFNAHYFSSNLSRWDTGKVTTMEKMFDGAAYFDSDLSSWNTRNVKNMKRMFLDAYNFNSDVSGWNTGKVTDMTWMFVNAHSFNQCLGSWAVSTPDDVVTQQMFMGSGCPLRDSDPTKGPWCQGFDDRCFGSCLDAEEFRFTIPSGKKKNCGFINKAKKARKFCKKPAFPDEVGQENVFIRHVCMKSCGTFGFGPGRNESEVLQNDPGTFLDLVKNHDGCCRFKYASDERNADRDFVMELVMRGCSGSLEFAAVELQGDREIVLTAVKQCGYALEYAAEVLKADKEVVLAPMKSFLWALQYSAGASTTNRKNFLPAVKSDARTWKYAADELKGDGKIVFVPVKSDGWTLDYTNGALRLDEKICKSHNKLTRFDKDEEQRQSSEPQNSVDPTIGRKSCNSQG